MRGKKQTEKKRKTRRDVEGKQAIKKMEGVEGDEKVFVVRKNKS